MGCSLVFVRAACPTSRPLFGFPSRRGEAGTEARRSLQKRKACLSKRRGVNQKKRNAVNPAGVSPDQE